MLVLTADTTRSVIGYFQDRLDVDEISSSPSETTTEKKLVLLAKWLLILDCYNIFEILVLERDRTDIHWCETNCNRTFKSPGIYRTDYFIVFTIVTKHDDGSISTDEKISNFGLAVGQYSRISVWDFADLTVHSLRSGRLQIEKKLSTFSFSSHREKLSLLHIYEKSNADCLNSYLPPQQKGNILPPPWILLHTTHASTQTRV